MYTRCKEYCIKILKAAHSVILSSLGADYQFSDMYQYNIFYKLLKGKKYFDDIDKKQL